MSDTQPARALCAAIARNCSGKCADAIDDVDALIREKPDNAVFLRAQRQPLLLERQIRESDPSPAQVTALAGGAEGLMQAELAQSMLATEDAGIVDEAITLLRRADRARR